MKVDLSIYDPEGRRKYLSLAEGERFVAAAMKLPTALETAFCLTLFYSGCRLSEVLALTGKAVQTEAGGLISVRSLKKRDKTQFRRIPIPPDLLERLQALAEESGGGRLWPIGRTTGWRIVKDAMDLARIKGVQACPKGLRHGFGVRAAMNQVPLPTIMKMMGHADMATTAIYLDVQDKETRELLERTW